MVSNKFAIHTNTLSSVYMDSSIKSKQTSQLLFGELLIIKSVRNNFYYIENYHDGHCGWVYKEVFAFLPAIEFERLKDRPVARICYPLASVIDVEDKSSLHLPAGSCLHDYEPQSGSFKIAKRVYKVAKESVLYLDHGQLDDIDRVTSSLMNAPFQEGGKSILGIDASGFVQLVFAMCGFPLPRGSQQQSKIGVSVYSLEQLRIGDVVFTQQEGVILKTYIYLGHDRLVSMEEKIIDIELSEIQNCTSSLLIRRLV